MTDLTLQRRFFSEEIQAASNLRNAAVVDALATVPRERFLRGGPWTIRGETEFQASPRQTPDADPRHVYHNVAVAIDAARTLYNGMPSLLAMAIDQLALQPGGRVLHVGVGTGYYTAIAAHCVGRGGRVLGIEVDASLAAEARANLSSISWTEVRHGDGSSALDESFDAILINAGVTHPLESWLDALADGGRMVLPLTATMPAMGPIGKGPLVLLTRTDAPDVLDARTVGFVAIYSAVGLRDEALNERIGQVLTKMPMPPLKHLRRDRHDATDTCWLHRPMACLSTA
jgi:protein-L-isoaspartate(D-aspartate) O-methyltransferase